MANCTCSKCVWQHVENWSKEEGLKQDQNATTVKELWIGLNIIGTQAIKELWIGLNIYNRDTGKA